MSVADKLLQVNQVKQAIKLAIEMKGIDLTGVAFTDYANKILEISSEVEVDEHFYYSKNYYIIINKSTLFENAWESSLAVDPSEISANSVASPRGTAQYPNGEIEGVIIPSSVTSIGGGAFYNWSSNNQPLVIPNSVTSIGISAFNRWTSNNLTLVIPNSVTSIGNQAFSNWTSNDYPLAIPESVISISDYAFSSWLANNKPLVIPNGVTSIGGYAFYNWSSNNQPLVIPNSVTNIGQNAFYNWLLVPYIEIQAITPPTLASDFAFGNQNNAPIYVPDESVEAYKTATNWVSLANRIFSINDK
jgi:hypothetical protein